MKKIPLFWKLNILIISAFLIYFLHYPTIFILKKAFFPVQGFSLAFFGIIFKNEAILQAIINSFVIGITVTVLCCIISLPLAWFMSRYRLPGQGLLTGWLMLPMILPPFVGAIGMKQFLSRFGTLNIILMNAGIIDAPIDWLGSGFWGVVILESLHLFPILYLNISAALANIDPALEEASWNLSGSTSSFIRKILLPLATPGIFAGCAIVFIWSVTDLGTPLILEYRNVVAYQIFNMLSDIYENPMGYALVVFLLIWISLIYYVSKKFFLHSESYMATRGVRGVEKPVPSKRATVVILAGFFEVGIIDVMPHIMLVLSSLAEKWFMTALPDKFTFDYYKVASEHPLTVLSVRNSLFLSSITTVIDVFIGLSAAYLIARYRFIGRGFFDFSVMLPLALPGLIVSFGYVGTFAGTWLDPRINPFPLLIAAYSVRRLPFMVRSVDAGLQQMNPAMEEASLNLGASNAKTLWKITFPLVSSNIIAGGILVFSFAMLEVSDSLILAMKQNFYPLTKAIYALSFRLGDGFSIASVLGVFSMMLLGGSMIIAGKILGKKMGALFRM